MNMIRFAIALNIFASLGNLYIYFLAPLNKRFELIALLTAIICALATMFLVYHERDRIKISKKLGNEIVRIVETHIKPEN